MQHVRMDLNMPLNIEETLEEEGYTMKIINFF